MNVLDLCQLHWRWQLFIHSPVSLLFLTFHLLSYFILYPIFAFSCFYLNVKQMLRYGKRMRNAQMCSCTLSCLYIIYIYNLIILVHNNFYAFPSAFALKCFCSFGIQPESLFHLCPFSFSPHFYITCFLLLFLVSSVFYYSFFAPSFLSLLPYLLSQFEGETNSVPNLLILILY